MSDFLIKPILCISILLFGNNTFAQCLNSIEIRPADGMINNKIILNTDSKSSIKKFKISDNEIELVLKNTSISDNIKTFYYNTDNYCNITFLQNGKNANINIKADNINNYEVFSLNNSNSSGHFPKKILVSFLTAFILLFLFLSDLKFHTKKLRNEYLIKKSDDKSCNNSKIALEHKRIKELKTIRTKILYSQNKSIIENNLPKFSSEKNLKQPQTLQYKNGKLYFDYDYKKAVNF